MTLESKICEAIDIIVQQAVSEAAYDKTIQAVTVECVDSSTGQYTVKYQDATFYAYSQSTDVTYTNGTSVWVLVPGNDMSKTKTILGTVTKLGTDYVTIVEDEDNYEINGTNCITSSTDEYGLKSYLESESDDADAAVVSGADDSLVITADDASVKSITGAVGSLQIASIDADSLTATAEDEALKLVITLSDNDNIIVLYSRDDDINLIGLDTTAVDCYIAASDYIMCAMTARTELPTEQQTQGNYGIIFALDFNDPATGNVITRYYTIDVDKMTGNPYKFLTDTRQYCVFEIDSENFIEVNYISLFCYNFPNHKPEEECIEDIFLSAFELYGVNYVTQDENGYILTIKAPSGLYFTSSSVSADTKTLQAQFSVNGNVITAGSDDLFYYWFVEHAGITTASPYYNRYGGQGWKCLNDYEVISSSSDGSADVVEWANANYYLTIAKSDVAAAQTVYKCVVVYAGAAISKTATIINLDSSYSLSIESDAGTQFYFNQGNPTLTCLVNGEEVSNYTYSWSLTDINNNYSSLSETTTANTAYDMLVGEYETLLMNIENGNTLYESCKETLESLETQIAAYETVQRVDGNKIYHVDISSITTASTYKCTVYADDLYIGTVSITLYNTLSTEGNYSLIINNGSYTYKYNESGVSPASEAADSPISISALTFTLYDNLGNELSDDVIANCHIQWIVPNENSMIEIPEGYEATASADGYDYYVGLTTLAYTIASIYDASKVNNDIKLIVTYQDLVLTAITDLNFIKEGETGTNGTEFTCKIVPNVTSVSSAPSVPIVTEYSDGSWEFNYEPLTEDIFFKIQLWHNDVKIFEDVTTGSSDEGKTVTIRWSILKNNYGVGTDLSDYTIDGTTGEVTFSGYSGSLSDLSKTYSYPVNIVKATVTYDSLTYYVTLPIITVKLTNDDYGVVLKENTGFLYALYTTDGVSPQYASAQPFELTVTQDINGYTEDVSTLTNSYAISYNWFFLGSIYDSSVGRFVEDLHLMTNESVSDLARNQYAAKPYDSFDGECLSNAVEVILLNAGSEVARIHIPIHMYLNRYGQSALNGWDGNSISISDDGGYILAPQVGAGYKEDDNSFTGVLMGSVKEAGASEIETGLFGYYQGVRTIFLDATTGSAAFGAAGKGQILIDPTNDIAQIYSGNYSTEDGTGLLIDLTTPEIRYGSGNFTVDANGYVHMTGATIEGYSTTEDVDEVRNASIVNVTTYYAESTSATTAPTSGWSSTQPTARAGYYIWVQTIVTYGDDTQEETYMLLTGNEGVGIASITEYYLTTTDTTTPDISYSEWVTSIDDLKHEFSTTYKYLWNYEKVTYTDGNAQSTSPIIISVYASDGENGEDGRGIVSITNYYATSNSATTAPTSGWTTDPSNAVISSTVKYLWNYEAIVYTDSDTPETTTPAVIGAYGDTGTDGITLYTWVKFASDDTGSDMTDDPEGMSYIGLSYNNTSSLESSDPDDYQWTLFKGSDGVDGEPGADGTSTYTWIKFADDANGTNMSDDPTGKYYIGFAYNKDTAEESSSPSDYDWALFRGSNGVDGTGINIKGSAYAKTTATISVSGSTVSIVSTTSATTSSVTNAYGYTDTLMVLNNGSLVDSVEDSETLAIDTSGYVIGNSNYILYYDEEFTNQITDPEESDSYLVNGYLFVWSGTDDYFTCVGKIQGTGIESVIEYYAVSASSTVSPDSWETNPANVTLSAENKYLWNYEAIIYTDGSISTTSPVVIGNFAEDGQDGEDGATIESITEYYGVSSSVATQPSKWTTDASSSTAIMTSSNKYLWNYEVIKYTDGRSTTLDAVIIGVYGDEGNGIESITAYYIASSSATSAPTFSASTLANWSTDMSSVSVSNTQYLWMAYLFTYTNGGTTYSAPACLTDDATRKNVTTLTEYYSTLVTDVEGISGDLTKLTTTVSDNYTTLNTQILTLVANAETVSTTLSNLTETTISGGRNYCLLSGDYTADGSTGWHHLNPPTTVGGSASVDSVTSTTITMTTDPTQTTVSSTTNAEIYDATTGSAVGSQTLKQIILNNDSISASASSSTLTITTDADTGSSYLTVSTYDGYTDLYAVARTTGHYASISLSEPLEAGETYTLTIKLKMSAKKTFNIYALTSAASYAFTIGSIAGADNTAGTYFTTTLTFTAPGTAASADYDEIGFDIYEAFVANKGTIDVQWIKLEKGSIATDWTCAPEDISVAALQSIVTQTVNSWSVTLQENYATKAELALVLDTDTGEATLSASANYITLSASNELRITSGNFTIDSSGNVTMTGKVTATSGYIGNGSSGFTITSTSIYNGKSSLTSNTQGVYIGTDGISVGVSSSAYIRLTASTGLLTATNANITGTITATSGFIGTSSSNGFTIAKGSTYYCIYSGSKSTLTSTNSGVYIGPDGISLGSYSSSSYSYPPFYVTSSGTLVARSATISGSITATSGTFGGWTVTSTAFYKQTAVTEGTASTQYEVRWYAPSSASSTTVALYIRHRSYDGSSYGSSYTNDVYIRYNGTGIIGSWTLTATSLYNGTSSISSTTAGVYLGTNGFRNYASSSAYATITSGVLTAVGATITGEIRATSGYIGSGTTNGWNITSKAIYNGTTSLTSTSSGMYVGTDGIRNYYSSSKVVTITQGMLTAYGAVITGEVTATTLLAYDNIKVYSSQRQATVIAITDFYSSESYGFQLGSSSAPIISFYGSSRVILNNGYEAYAVCTISNTNSQGALQVGYNLGYSTINDSYSQFRAVYGGYGLMLRNDGSNSYLLLSTSTSGYGTWTSDRPFYINNSTASVYMQTIINPNTTTDIGRYLDFHYYATTKSSNTDYDTRLYCTSGGNFYITTTTYWSNSSGSFLDADTQYVVLQNFGLKVEKPIYITGGYSLHVTSGNGVYDDTYGWMVRYNSGVSLGNGNYTARLRTSDNVYKNSSTTTYFSTTSSSDRRLKNEVSSLDVYEDMFMDLNPIAFTYHDRLYNIGDTKPLIQWGFYADEVITAFTDHGIDWEKEELVVVEDGELTAEEAKYIDDDKLLKMNYQNLTALNTHMIQKAFKEIEALQAENEELKQQLKEIKG